MHQKPAPPGRRGRRPSKKSTISNQPKNDSSSTSNDLVQKTDESLLRESYTNKPNEVESIKKPSSNDYENTEKSIGVLHSTVCNELNEPVVKDNDLVTAVETSVPVKLSESIDCQEIENLTLKIDHSDSIKTTPSISDENMNPKECSTNAVSQETETEKQGKPLRRSSSSATIENVLYHPGVALMPVQSVPEIPRTIECVQGDVAPALYKGIIKVIKKLCKKDKTRLEEFKINSRLFGNDFMEAPEYFKYLLQDFGGIVALLLVPCLLQIQTDEEKRQNLILAASNWRHQNFSELEATLNTLDDKKETGSETCPPNDSIKVQVKEAIEENSRDGCSDEIAQDENSKEIKFQVGDFLDENIQEIQHKVAESPDDNVHEIKCQDVDSPDDDIQDIDLEDEEASETNAASNTPPNPLFLGDTSIGINKSQDLLVQDANISGKTSSSGINKESKISEYCMPEEEKPQIIRPIASGWLFGESIDNDEFVASHHQQKTIPQSKSESEYSAEDSMDDSSDDGEVLKNKQFVNGLFSTQNESINSPEKQKSTLFKATGTLNGEDSDLSISYPRSSTSTESRNSSMTALKSTENKDETKESNLFPIDTSENLFGISEEIKIQSKPSYTMDDGSEDLFGVASSSRIIDSKLPLYREQSVASYESSSSLISPSVAQQRQQNREEHIETIVSPIPVKGVGAAPYMHGTFRVSMYGSHEQLDEDSGKFYTEYILRCSWADIKDNIHYWMTARRYREFYALDLLLKEKFPQIAFNFPLLPGKKYIGSSLSAEFVDKRQKDLGLYITGLVEDFPILVEDETMDEFLDIKRNVMQRLRSNMQEQTRETTRQQIDNRLAQLNLPMKGNGQSITSVEILELETLIQQLKVELQKTRKENLLENQQLPKLLKACKDHWPHLRTSLELNNIESDPLIPRILQCEEDMEQIIQAYRVQLLEICI